MKKSARWTHWDHFGAWAILAFLVWFAVWALTDVTRNFNLSAIQIPDVAKGEPITISMSRVITGTWHGGYRVTIREVPSGAMVCTTGDVFLRYSDTNADGTPRLLPDPVYLKWWADGGTCTYALADKTLPPGRYSVESCHAKRFLWFFHKWHCWQGGPIFEVRERGQ